MGKAVKSKKRSSKKMVTFPCPECSKVYKTSQGLNVHKKKLHPAIVRPGPGKPLKFESVEEVENLILEYFESCMERWEDYDTYEPVRTKSGGHKIKDGAYQYKPVKKKRLVKAKVPTVSGLAVALDTTRQTLLDYQERDEYADTIKRAKQTIQAMVEALLTNGGAHPSGVIFSLKNNWGWVDKQELDVTDKAAAAKKALDGVDQDHDSDFSAQAAKVLNGGS